MAYVHTSWWMACSKCCVFTIARIFPAEFDAQYGVTISIFDSQASTLFAIQHRKLLYNTKQYNQVSNRPVTGSLGGDGPFPSEFPRVELLDRPKLFDWRFDRRQLLKYEDPLMSGDGISSISDPGGPTKSGTPGGGISFAALLRFPDEGGPYWVDISKSPYIRRISALLSSMNSAIRLLKQRHFNYLLCCRIIKSQSRNKKNIEVKY